MDGFTELTIDKLKNGDGINELNRMFTQLYENAVGDGDSVRIYKGYGTPEGAVTAGVGSIYMRLDGGTGTAQYRKETGTGATGWVAIVNSVVYSRYLSCTNPNPIQNLTSSDMGKLIFAGGVSAANVTLPEASTLSSGDIVTIIAQNSVTTISRSGADTIYKDGITGPVTSVTLSIGNAYKFVVYNSSIWIYVIES